MIRCATYSATLSLAVVSNSAVATEPPKLEYRGPYAQGEASLSLAAESGTNRGRTRLARSFALKGLGGYRFTDLALFGMVEPNFWRSPTLDDDEELVMAVNMGVGGEVLSLHGFVRTSLAFGPSVFAIPTEIDEGGEVGFFLDFRPAGLRWSLAERYILGFDPLSFAVVMPVLTGIPLVEIQYRTSIYLERRF